MGEPSFWAEFLGSSIRFVDVAGMRTRCVEAGEGVPLLLLHGGGGHLEAFSRNVGPLSAHYHVYAVDQAGHGLTDRHPGITGIRGVADHLLGFMDTLGIRQAHLAGESMGGSAAALLALEHPERVLKVAYITGAGLHVGEEWDRLAAQGRDDMRRLSAAARDNPTREAVRARLAWLFADPGRSLSDELVEIRYRIYARQAAERSASPPTAATRAAEEVTWTPDRLRQIQVPFLFLWTDHNPTPLPIAEQAQKEMPGSKLEVIKNAGHWPQYEQPEEFHRVLLEFLGA